MDKKEYKNNLSKLKNKYSQSKENFEKSNKNLESIRDKSSGLIDINKNNIDKINKTLSLLDSLPEESNSIESTEFDQTFEFASSFGELLERQSFSLEERSKNYESSFGILVAGTNVSASSTDAASASVINLASVFLPFHKPMQKALDVYKIPSPLDKKDEIEEWLGKINVTIRRKYSEAFDNLSNSKFMSACHALRDCLSQFWEHLAPDEKVRECKWFEEVPVTGRPTQKQRIKFIIIGNTDENILTEDDLVTLEKLMNEGRGIYEKLTVEAHSRKGDWDEKRTRSYFEITNNFLITIKQLKIKL